MKTRLKLILWALLGKPIIHAVKPHGGGIKLAPDNRNVVLVKNRFGKIGGGIKLAPDNRNVVLVKSRSIYAVKPHGGKEITADNRKEASYE